MIFTVRQVLTAIAEKLGGSGVDLCQPNAMQQALAAYNRINEILMSHRDWPGTEFDICIPCTADGLFHLPQRFASITAARWEADVLPILPMGFRYLPSGPGNIPRDGSLALTHIGSHFGTALPLAKPMPLFFTAPEPTVIHLQGTDATGRMQQQRIGTAGQDGTPRTAPFAEVAAVSKPVTAHYVEMFAWDDYEGTAHWLGCMEPGDTQPSFTRYRATGKGPGHIQAAVSCAYREIWDPDEISIIQAREPYRLMTQAIHHFDRSELAPAAEFQNRAMKLLKNLSAKLAKGQKEAIPFEPSRAAARRHISIRSY